MMSEARRVSGSDTCKKKSTTPVQLHELRGRIAYKLTAHLVSARRTLLKIWRGLREWSGDAAYERYLRSPRARVSGSIALSPAEFYLEQLNRRYSRPNRCC